MRRGGGRASRRGRNGARAEVLRQPARVPDDRDRSDARRAQVQSQRDPLGTGAGRRGAAPADRREQGQLRPQSHRRARDRTGRACPRADGNRHEHARRRQRECVAAGLAADPPGASHGSQPLAKRCDQPSARRCSGVRPDRAAAGRGTGRFQLAVFRFGAELFRPRRSVAGREPGPAGCRSAGPQAQQLWRARSAQPAQFRQRGGRARSPGLGADGSQPAADRPDHGADDQPDDGGCRQEWAAQRAGRYPRYRLTFAAGDRCPGQLGAQRRAAGAGPEARGDRRARRRRPQHCRAQGRTDRSAAGRLAGGAGSAPARPAARAGQALSRSAGRARYGGKQPGRRGNRGRDVRAEPGRNPARTGRHGGASRTSAR